MGYSSNDPANYLAVAKQSAQRTEATTGFKFIRYIEDSGIKAEIESEDVFEGGNGQDEGLHYKKWVNPDGQIVTYARPDTFAYLSAWAMGSAFTPASVADTGIASHLYVPNATLPYLTIEQAFGAGAQIERVTDAIVSGWQLEAEAGNPWKLTTPFVGGGTYYYRDGAASGLTSSYEAGDPAFYADGWKLIDGATSLDVRQFSLNMERKVDTDLRTNQPFRRDVVPLTRSLTVAMQVIYQDAALWKKIQFGAGSQVPVALATGALYVANTLQASSQQLYVSVPYLHYKSVTLNKLAPDGETLVLDIEAKAVKNAATSLVLVGANIIGRATSYLVS